MRIAQIGVALCLATFVLISLGCLGLVRVSPNQRYVTVVAPITDSNGETKEFELRMYDLQTRETIPVRRLDFEERIVVASQWSPDSQRFVFLESEQRSDPLYLFDVTTRSLEQLPIEDVGAAVWSADGAYLLVAHRVSDADSPAGEGTLMLNWHRTTDWAKVHSVRAPAGISDVGSIDWARTFPDDAFKAIVHLGNDLYRVQSTEITPLTTTGDVKAFWFSPQEHRVRWVRVQNRRFLAVFERNLATGVVKRLALLLPSMMPLPEGYEYRFSPNGERLAWDAGDYVIVLTIPTQQVRLIQAVDAKHSRRATQPQSESGFQISVPEAPALGLDWQDNNTLLILRDELEVYTFVRLKP